MVTRKYGKVPSGHPFGSILGVNLPRRNALFSVQLCTEIGANQFALYSLLADRERKTPVRPLRGKPNDLEFWPMFMRPPGKNVFVNGSYWERIALHDWSYRYESNMLTIYPSVEIIRKGRWIGCLHDAVSSFQTGNLLPTA
jgi:hypothetical protein